MIAIPPVITLADLQGLIALPMPTAIEARPAEVILVCCRRRFSVSFLSCLGVLFCLRSCCFLRCFLLLLRGFLSCLFLCILLLLFLSCLGVLFCLRSCCFL